MRDFEIYREKFARGIILNSAPDVEGSADAGAEILQAQSIWRRPKLAEEALNNLSIAVFT